MRIASEAGYYDMPEPCNFSEAGEYEDYTVVLRSNESAPGTNFEFSYIDECQGVVQFTDLSTNFATSWSWDFGDGTTASTLQNPIHAFAAAGTYVVVLTATNEFGTNAYNLSVEVNALNPVIQYTGIPETNTALTFTSNTLDATTWTWNFGDGTTSNEENPVHTYTSMGIYTVSVIVMNAAGCTAATNIELDVLIYSVEELEREISIYPNPSSGVLYIILSSNEKKILYQK